MEVTERRIPLAEIVQSELDPERPELRERGRCRLYMFHDRALCDLHLEAARVKPRLQQETLDLEDQIGLRKLPTRQVHTHGQGRGRPELRLPFPELFCRGVEHPQADGQNELRFFG